MAAQLAFGPAVHNAQMNIQVHGGHRVHLGARRAPLPAAGPGAQRACSARPDDAEDVTAQAARGTTRDVSLDLPPEAEAIRADVRAEAERIGTLAGRGAAQGAGRSRACSSRTGPTPWGRAAGAVEQIVIDEELRAAGVKVPGLGITGWNIMTVNQYATPDQVERWVFKTLMGEYVWCQLFSEPDAGSDAAAVKTRGTRVDGGWRVNGQKVWTSGAQYCHLGLATVRTNPDAPKHAGITTMVIDMHAPGVEVRPLRQITGNADFNEVFFNDVFVPDDDVVGTPDDGWTVARSTLGNERVSIGGGVGGIFPAMDLLALLKSGGDRVPGAAARVGAILTKDHALKAAEPPPGPAGRDRVGPGTRRQRDQAGAGRARPRPGTAAGRPRRRGHRVPRRRGGPGRVLPAGHPGHVDRGRDVRDHPQPDRRAHPRAAPGPADRSRQPLAGCCETKATRSQPSCDAAVTDARCTVHAGVPVGDRHEGGAVQASVRAVETRNVPTAGAAPARAGDSAAPLRRRLPQRAIELVGLALGIAFIAAVALGPRAVQRRVLVAGRRPVDAGPPPPSSAWTRSATPSRTAAG